MSDDRDDRRDSVDRRGESGGRRDAPTDPEALDERVAELEAHVRELRDELRRPPEGPLGLPRPPTPREVLSFTGEYAIPTAIAVLEANVRALKALQQVVRVLDPERSVVDEERDRLESRAADASRATLDRLESALADVETTVQESDLPRDDAARDILDDARRINREIRDRVGRERTAADEARERAREADRGRDRASRDERERAGADDESDDLPGGTTIELTDEGDDGTDASEDGDDASEDSDGTGDGGDRVEVDVEAELRSIKDEMENRQRNAEAGAADAEGKSAESEDDAPSGGEDGDESAEGKSDEDGDDDNDDAS